MKISRHDMQISCRTRFKPARAVEVDLTSFEVGRGLQARYARQKYRTCGAFRGRFRMHCLCCPVDGDYPPKLFLRTLGTAGPPAAECCRVAALGASTACFTSRTTESTSLDPQKAVDGEKVSKPSPRFARSVMRDGVVPSVASPLQTRAVPLWCCPVSAKHL